MLVLSTPCPNIWTGTAVPLTVSPVISVLAGSPGEAGYTTTSAADGTAVVITAAIDSMQDTIMDARDMGTSLMEMNLMAAIVE
jgi:hypothetical protein